MTGSALGFSLAMALATGALAAGPTARKAANATSKSPATASFEALDQKRIHQEYNDGDFNAVTDSLENFMKRNKAFSQADSVFIAKHLAVIYTANPAMREKGKYYMYRLLDLLPSAKLLDMFVSDEIDRIFDKIRDEYFTRKGVPSAQPESLAVASPSQDTVPAAPPLPEKKSGSSTVKILAWTGAGVAVVGGGVLTYFLLQSPDAPKTFLIDGRTGAP